MIAMLAPCGFSGSISEHARNPSVAARPFAWTPAPVSGQTAASAGPTVCRIGVNTEDLCEFDLARETFSGIL
jgi:hypothetical protein